MPDGPLDASGPSPSVETQTVVWWIEGLVGALRRLYVCLPPGNEIEELLLSAERALEEALIGLGAPPSAVDGADLDVRVLSDQAREGLERFVDRGGASFWQRVDDLSGGARPPL